MGVGKNKHTRRISRLKKTLLDGTLRILETETERQTHVNDAMAELFGHDDNGATFAKQLPGWVFQEWSNKCLESIPQIDGNFGKGIAFALSKLKIVWRSTGFLIS